MQDCIRWHIAIWSHFNNYYIERYGEMNAYDLVKIDVQMRWTSTAYTFGIKTTFLRCLGAHSIRSLPRRKNTL